MLGFDIPNKTKIIQVVCHRERVNDPTNSLSIPFTDPLTIKHHHTSSCGITTGCDDVELPLGSGSGSPGLIGKLCEQKAKANCQKGLELITHKKNPNENISKQEVGNLRPAGRRATDPLSCSETPDTGLNKHRNHTRIPEGGLGPNVV